MKEGNSYFAKIRPQHYQKPLYLFGKYKRYAFVELLLRETEHLFAPWCPVASNEAFSAEIRVIFQADKTLQAHWQPL